MALADTANLIVALRLDDKFSGPLSRVQGQVTGFGRGFSQIGRGVGQVASGFDRLATRAGLAAAGGLALVVKTAIDFEDAWAGVEKTVNETDLSKVGLNFEKLQEQFREMAREIPVAFEELAAIGEQAGALGIAAGDIEGFTRVVAKLGVTTDLSSEQAATALGQLGNVLHLSGGEFNEFADALVNLGNQGASTESQIIEIAARFGAAGNQAGLSKEEILGFSSAVASMGIQVEAGGSSLSRIFNSVTTNIGTGSAKAKEFAKVLRLPLDEFKDAWDKNASGTFQEFLAQLSKLDKFEAANVLKKIGVTNTRDINAILLMAQNTEELARQLKVAESSAGALNKEAEKRFATTASAIQRFKNVARDIGFVIGRELLPVINDALADLTRELAKPENQRAIKDFAANLAQGARDLVSAFKRGEFDTVISTLKGAAAVAKTAFDAFNALPGPVKQLALAAIVANKVTGGAVGQIAGGLAGIVGGSIRVLFPKLDIFSRGSPVNPMFVSVIGGGLGGALGGPGGALGAGRWGWIGNALKVTVIGAVAVEGFKLAADIAGINAPHHRDTSGRPARTTNDPSQQLANLIASLPNLRERAAGSDAFAAKQLAAVEQQIAVLRRILGVEESSINEFRRGRLEQSKNLQRVERRVGEARAAVGTGFRQFNSQEASRASRLQSALSVVNRNLATNNAKQQRIISGIDAARERIGNGFARSNDQLGIIARKETSFTANVTTNVTAHLSTYQALTTLTRVTRIRAGTGFTPQLLNG